MITVTLFVLAFLIAFIMVIREARRNGDWQAMMDWIKRLDDKMRRD